MANCFFKEMKKNIKEEAPFKHQKNQQQTKIKSQKKLYQHVILQ